MYQFKALQFLKAKHCAIAIVIILYPHADI